MSTKNIILCDRWDRWKKCEDRIDGSDGIAPTKNQPKCKDWIDGIGGKNISLKCEDGIEGIDGIPEKTV